MMKLYYSKGACSMAVHIAMEELGIQYEAIPVDLGKPGAPEFLQLNPMGAVPVLVNDRGEVMTEIAMLLQYLGDLKPEAGLMPRAGTMERYRIQEWLNFISTEIHKGFTPLWSSDLMSRDEKAQEEIENFAKADLGRKYDVILKKMAGRDYLMPSGYTLADAYLFTVLNWNYFLKVDLSKWPGIVDYMNRVRERPAVHRTLMAEHLISK